MSASIRTVVVEDTFRGIETIITLGESLTALEIKILYESNNNTNEFSDDEQAKLAGLGGGGDGTMTDSQVKIAYENNNDTNVFDDAARDKLAGLTGGGGGSMTAEEIKIAYESNANTNAFTDEHLASLGSPTVKTNSGTANNLVSSDDGCILHHTHASANVLTIKPEGEAVYGSPFMVSVTQKGAGATTITADTGVSLNGVSAGSATLNAQWDGITLYKDGVDAWVIQGAHGGAA